MSLGPSRAQNQDPLGTLGDPERWGGQTVFVVELPALSPGGQFVHGQQVVRVQFLDLRARACDILAFFEVEGQLVTDGPWEQRPTGFTGFGIEIAAGVGQTTTVLRASPVFGTPLNPWVQTLARVGQPSSGVLQIMFPMPGVALNIRPMFGTLLNGAGVANTLTVRSTILVSPRF